MANTGQYDSQTNIETEDYEREIFVRPEAAVIYGGSVVNSVNGQVGDVVLTTSDLENTSDYQTGAQVQNAIAGKQDKLTAGTNIQINNDVISATGTTYTAGNGLDLTGTEFSVDSTVVALQSDLPTVNDATLTIQKNSTDVGTFTANASSNSTINITVPTATSQLVNDSGYTTNTGTITSVKMNGSTVATSGEANLGTVITDVSEKQDIADNSLATSNKTVPGAINEVNSIAKGANQALSYASYQAMVTAFNSLASNVYNVGQNVMIITLQVPDLWISGIESTSQTYTYTTDEAFTTELNTNGYVQVGYYKLSALETQKVNLTNYVTFDDYATSTTAGVVITNSNFGVSTSSYTKNITAVTKTYAQYQNGNNAMFVGKGTLENVITGKNLETSNNKVTSISSSSTNTEYPSAKAVYDYIQSLDGDEVNY